MNDDPHAALIAAHHARLRALLDGDTEALAKVVGEDMIFISATGASRMRPEVVAALQSGAMKIERMESSDVSTRIYGDVGILIYRSDTKMTDGGVTSEGVTRSTTVYVRRDGGWQMVSQHQSRVE